MKFVYNLLFLIILLSCKSEGNNKQSNPKTITGKIDNTGVGYVLLEKIGDNTLSVVDTLTVRDDGTYFCTYHPEEPGYYRLNFYDTQFVTLILTDEPVIVNVDGSGPNAPYEVSGSNAMNALNDLNTLAEDFKKSVSNLNIEFSSAAKNNDMDKMQEIQNHYQLLQEQFRKAVKDRIRKMGTSVAVLQAINYLDMDNDFQFVDSVARAVEKNMPDYKIKNNFLDQINKVRKLAIGAIAPEIALPNPDGEIVKLSSLRGNYVLIDFWAAWCGPCRRENPNVVRLYQKYHDKGFEIFSVSLDRNRNDWLKAISNDGLNWTHVSDLNYFNSEAAKTYNINAIPATILLDQEGRIIGKNLRGESLEKKLEEIFG